ncbi:MAG TPA: MOSC domain-containing protein [Mycobacterium sp.]|nr:MOSC domain-containing protein [Mycobacterium sp.]
MSGAGRVLTVNVAQPRRNPDPTAGGGTAQTGIDKRPTTEPVAVRAPGPMQGGLGSGLVGDTIGNPAVHGGDDQAVYAYAREDLDAWETRLGREIGNGVFGENLTTSGIDVTNARIGERWAVGTGGLRLEVSSPRIPCRTFAEWLAIRGWVKTFTLAAVPGAYLRVIAPGTVSAGDQIDVLHRPEHCVSVGMVFRALTTAPQLLPAVLEADALTAEIKEKARRRTRAE